MPLSKEETKALMKEALAEWLDGKFMAFGKWSLMGIAALLFSAILHLILVSNGWHIQIPSLTK